MIRTATAFLILRRGRGRATARVVRAAVHRPRLGVGEVAVRITLDVVDEAFDPVLTAPRLTIGIGDAIRHVKAETTP